MKQIAGFDYSPLRFNREIGLVASAELEDILNAAPQYDDFLVLAHGWNNDMKEAEDDLYAQLLGSLALELPGFKPGATDATAAPDLTARKLGVIGVFWPSKKFADADLISGGAASVGGASPEDPTRLAERQIDTLKHGFYADEPFFDAPASDRYLDDARGLISNLDGSAENQRRFADLLRGLMQGVTLDRPAIADEEGLDVALTLGSQDLLDRLRSVMIRETRPAGFEGGAAGLSSMLESVRDAARRALNFATYFQMRERAGRTGRALNQHLFQALNARYWTNKPWPQKPLLHLVGHSFGGRLVTAAADGPGGAGADGRPWPIVRVTSMTLLQAAFSHYGFAAGWDGIHDGLFRRVLRERHVMGPILVTHTKMDKAVGIAYPLASALAGQVATALGGASDKFGGIGSNGAQKTPEAVTLTMSRDPSSQPYPVLMGGRLYNLDADRGGTLITNHSDVRGRPVAFAILSGMQAGIAIGDPPKKIEEVAVKPPTDRPAFDPSQLDKAIIAPPLLYRIAADDQALQPVIIDLNLNYPRGRDGAREKVIGLLRELGASFPETSHPQYLMGTIKGYLIYRLVLEDWREGPGSRGIYRIWPDFQVEPLIVRSVSTVKADAARRAFSALGTDIVWAVIDSGIDEKHPHFTANANIHAKNGDTHQGYHRDFTVPGNGPESARSALTDPFGHGTHVAGIIAGEQPHDPGRPVLKIERRSPYAEGNNEGSAFVSQPLDQPIGGMAPRCKLVSLRVLDDRGYGQTAALLEAINHVQEINGYGRRIMIHGVNLSLGYNFDPEWFGCGQSPLCIEVDRLVRSGVAVVVAAGNSGYGNISARSGALQAAPLALTINDPGNAALAITVGSTHRDMPHMYGVSYFSSKGPTGDGRMKPDLLAPGERIVSCATGRKLTEAIQASNVSGDYIEDSGTSMAAPHVSGALAAFLSVRREFIGQPETVKRIFCDTATDLGRDRHFQGSGLLDLMRAIQSV